MPNVLKTAVFGEAKLPNPQTMSNKMASTEVTRLTRLSLSYMTR